MSRLTSIGAILLAICALAASGCDKSVADAVGSMNDSNIKRVANLYTAYQKQHAWQGPKDEQALREFVSKQMSADKLELMGVQREHFDECLISERDGKPFKIKYGLKGGFRVVAAVVFEEAGVGGRRQIGSTNSVAIEDADRIRYDALWNQKSAPPVAAPMGPS
jgi:hypothetical protein